jgi:UPF0755 protein
MPPELPKPNFFDSVFLFIKKFKIVIIYSIAILFLAIIFYILSWSAPKNFPTGSIYDLKSGQTLSVVSDNFLQSNIIRSEFWFKSFVYIFSSGKSTLIEGDYAMQKKENVITLAWRVTHGKLDVLPVRVTITEGMDSYQIADLLASKFPSFNKNTFLTLVQTEKLEGYLFPDTYFLMPNMTEEQIIEIMNNNFNKKIQTESADIAKFGKSESDVIKIASILEGEGRTIETRETIAGILWKRIALGMPLQVDASFKYIDEMDGKPVSTFTSDDLKIASPYNSYTNTGLPPTPISNPGLETINDAINPIKTSYLYYLTDKDGNMHYATTFAEHEANILKYLQ